MTDQATTDLSGADLSAAPIADANGSGQDAGGNPFEGLDEGLMKTINGAGIKSLTDLATAYGKDRSFINDSIRYPGADDAEKLEGYYSKLRPETSDKYTMPTEIPDNVPFDADMAGAFAGIAHAHGLTDAQFQGVMGDLLKSEAVTGLDGKVAESTAQQVEQRATTAYDAITEKFGGAGSEEFNAAASQVKALYDQSPDVKDSLQALGLIDPSDGAVLDANVFNLLHALSGSAQVQANGKIDATPNTDGDVGINPENGLITDQAKAVQLYNSDPERYRQMIAAAKS